MTSGIRSLLRFSNGLRRALSTNSRSPITDKLSSTNCITATVVNNKSSHNLRAIHQSPFADIVIPKCDFAGYFHETFSQYADIIAVIDGLTGKKTTYIELLKEIENVSNGLWRLGLRKGDVVTIVSENRIEFLTTFLACNSIGVTVSSLNPLYTPDEIEYAVKLTDSKLIFVSSNCYKGVVKTMEKHKFPLVGIYYMQIIFGAVSFGDIEGIRPLSSFTEKQSSELNLTGGIDFDVFNDIAALPLSSGTTGLPKAVKLTHNNLVSNIEQLNLDAIFSTNPGKDISLGVLPWFHIYGQTSVVFSCLHYGGTIVIMPTFTPELFVKCMQAFKPTILSLVPALMTFIGKHPLVTSEVMSSVRIITTGAAACDPELMNIIADKFKIPNIRQGYGLTEASPITHVNPEIGYRYDTCGPSLPNTKWKIIDHMTGDERADGKEGEICVMGPQVMKGYLGNEKETNDVLKDNWLHTGDVGYCNDVGHLVITDRLKELIKYKGMQIAPAELELLLQRHPAVAESAVIGIPCDQSGEVPRAYVVLHPLPDGVVIGEQQIIDFVKGKVAPHKQLRGGVEIRRQIPKSSTGKVLRRLLRKDFLSKPSKLPKQ